MHDLIPSSKPAIVCASSRPPSSSRSQITFLHLLEKMCKVVWAETITVDKPHQKATHLTITTQESISQVCEPSRHMHGKRGLIRNKRKPTPSLLKHVQSIPCTRYENMKLSLLLNLHQQESIAFT